MSLALNRMTHVSGRTLSLLACFVLFGCAEQIAKEPASSPKPQLGQPSDGAGGKTSAPGEGTPPSTPAASSPAKAGATLKRLVVLTNGNSPFWDAARAGLQDAERELQLEAAGFSAVFEVNNGTPEGQVDKLKQFASQSDIAGVAVSVTRADNVAIADELRKLRAKGVQVLTVDSDVDRATLRDARTAFIGTDNLEGGRVLGRCAQGLRPDGGEYVAFFGIAGAQNVLDRTGGFAQGAGDAFQVKDLMADDVDLTRARDNVRNAIRNHPELKVLVGIWSYNAPAIVDVVTELNRRKDFTIVVFDAEPGAITAMRKGNIDAMVVQNPYAMGYESIKLLKALAQDDQSTVKEMLPRLGEPDGDIFDTGLKVVVPSAESPLTKEMFPANVEFLTLDAFQQWLDKYGLTGS
jgi:ribose transport system substrate-binding protein